MNIPHPNIPRIVRIAGFCLAAGSAMLLASCASGPSYQASKPSLVPKPGKGLTLIYEKPGAFGAAANYPLYVNDTMIGTHKRGGFYTVDSGPGEVCFGLTHPPNPDDPANSPGSMAAAGAIGGMIGGGPIGAVLGAAGGAIAGAAAKNKEKTRTRPTETIDVRAKETYYIEVVTGFEPELRRRSAADAEPDLLKCKWVNPP